jgi:hypothetical protein
MSAQQKLTLDHLDRLVTALRPPSRLIGERRRVLSLVLRAQEHTPDPQGLSWQVLDGSTHQLLLAGKPVFDLETGQPVTLEELEA